MFIDIICMIDFRHYRNERASFYYHKLFIEQYNIHEQ